MTRGCAARRIWAALMIAVLCAGLVAPVAGFARPAAAAAAATDPRFFAETGHYVSGRFREYWEGRGGLFVFGLPLTGQFAFPSTDGRTYQTQFFERAVFELHPENAAPYDVLLTLVGNETAAQRGGITPPV